MIVRDGNNEIDEHGGIVRLIEPFLQRRIALDQRAELFERLRGRSHQGDAPAAAVKAASTHSLTLASITRWTRSASPRLAWLCGSDSRRYQQLPDDAAPVQLERDAVIGRDRDVKAHDALLETKVVVAVFLDDRAGGETHQADRL